MKKKRITTGIWGVLYPFALYYVGHYLIVAIALVFMRTWKDKEVTYSMYGILNAAGMLGGLAFLYPSIQLERGNQKRRKVPFYQYGMLLPCSISAVIWMNMVLKRLGLVQHSQTFQETAQRQFGVSIWIGLLLYGVIAPLAEEFLFRFVLFRRIRGWTGNLIAGAIGSALLFGIYHGNVVQGVYAFLLGCVLVLVFLYYENIWAAVLFHSLGNIVIFLCGIYAQLEKVFFAPACMPFYGCIFLLCVILQMFGIRKQQKNKEKEIQQNR